MMLDKVVGSLDPANPLYKQTVADIRQLADTTSLFLARKGRDLLEVVHGFCEDGRFPVVDKKLGIVAGCWSGFHEDLRAILWQYHAASCGAPVVALSIGAAATRYLADGHGYYISPMVPCRALTSHKYRPDRFDKDLFLVYPALYVI